MNWSACSRRTWAVYRLGAAVVIWPAPRHRQTMFEMRVEKSQAATARADQRGEPPLDDDA
jgi:hypothetical protein